MLAIGDRINEPNMAVTRYLARLQAPIAAWFYPAQARDRILVLTYDDQFLEETGDAWPLSYATHADWLERLSGDPGASPRAIFVDITFGQYRADPSLPLLVQALCRIREHGGPPIFLAGVLSRRTGMPTLRQEFAGKHTRAGDPCFTLVGITAAADPVDGLSWSYPLTRHAADGRLVEGPRPQPESARTPGSISGPAPASGSGEFLSAALRLAQDVEGLALGPETAPLGLVWGDPVAVATPADYWLDCGKAEPLWLRLVPRMLRDVAGHEPSLKPCPPQPTLSMAQLMSMDESALAEHISGKYLLIGAMISGYDDIAVSPVHGPLPGVFAHAMALDNLLVYGSRYKRHNEWSLSPPLELLMAGLLTVLAMYLVRTLVIGLGRRMRASIRRTAVAAWHRASPVSPPAGSAGWAMQWVGRTALQPAGAFVGWTLRVWLQFVVAALLIVLLQRIFDLGMLSLVELAGMTLLAEALNYVARVRSWLFPEESGPSDSMRSNKTQEVS